MQNAQNESLHPLFKENRFVERKKDGTTPLLPNSYILFNRARIIALISELTKHCESTSEKKELTQKTISVIRKNIKDLNYLLRDYGIDLNGIKSPEKEELSTEKKLEHRISLDTSEQEKTQNLNFNPENTLQIIQDSKNLMKILEKAKNSIDHMNSDFLLFMNENLDLPALSRKVLELFSTNKIKNSQDFWQIINEEHPEMDEKDKESYIYRYRKLVDDAFIHFLNDLGVSSVVTKEPKYEQRRRELIKIWDGNLDHAYKLFTEFIKIIDKKNKQYHLNIPFELDLPEELQSMNVLELISVATEKTICKYSEKTKYTAQWLCYIAYLFEVVRNLDLDQKVGCTRKTLNINALGALDEKNNTGLLVENRNAFNKKNRFDFKMKNEEKRDNKAIKELKLRETKFSPPNEDKNIKFYFINPRQKSPESIVKKLIGREPTGLEDIHDHLACSFVLTESSAEIINSRFSEDQTLFKKVDYFVKNIGNNYLGLKLVKKDRRDLENGEFIIDYDKLKSNKNESSNNYAVIKIYGRKNDINVEAQILPIDTFLNNENYESPTSHEYYEETRMLQYVKNFFPQEIFPDVIELVSEILKHRKVRTKMREKNISQSIIWLVGRLKRIFSERQLKKSK